jgi:hypothetical protein
MRKADVDRDRSEKSRSLSDFLTLYNENLPDQYPRATAPLLTEFKKTHAEFFKLDIPWSLNLHRKRVMDWLRGRPL